MRDGNNRRNIGAAEKWEEIEKWLTFEGPIELGQVTMPEKAERKCPEVKVLKSYAGNPGDEFWRKFPYSPLPEKIETGIDVDTLEELVEEEKSKMTCHQKNRAEKCIRNLREGAPSCQAKQLPAMFAENIPSAEKNGPLMTDTIAVWVKKGFVSGPFSGPPMSQFRVNPLMAIERNGKVRPVLNVSETAGRSFNDNVDTNKIEKSYMSTAKEFGHALRKAGRGAVMSKFDMSDAYKNIPAKLEDLRLQGFCWLGKYFVEKKQIFGAKTSVSNFDIFGHVLQDLATVGTGVPREMVLRRLDDVPIIGPEGSGWCERFTAKYQEVCKRVNVKLAEDCPKKDKAFKNQKEGKVLGIWFNSEELTWAIPDEKRYKTLKGIKEATEGRRMNLLDMQKLMGRISDISQLCVFMTGFRGNLNKELGWFQNNPEKTKKLSKEAVKELWVWAGMLIKSERYPIPNEAGAPPLRAVHISSDAAGDPEGKGGRGAGIGGVGLNEEGEVNMCFQYLWKEEMITKKKDDKGARMGSKTTFLETVGMTVSWLTYPEEMAGKHIVMSTDNTGCFFGWENKHVKGDNLASVLIRVILVLSTYMNAAVHVEKVMRKSTWGSDMADKLSREVTTRGQAAELLKAAGGRELPQFFKEWMDDPTEDLTLPLKCLEYVKGKIKMY